MGQIEDDENKDLTSLAPGQRKPTLKIRTFDRFATKDGPSRLCTPVSFVRRSGTAVSFSIDE